MIDNCCNGNGPDGRINPFRNRSLIVGGSGGGGSIGSRDTLVAEAEEISVDRSPAVVRKAAAVAVAVEAAVAVAVAALLGGAVAVMVLGCGSCQMKQIWIASTCKCAREPSACHVHIKIKHDLSPA